MYIYIITCSSRSLITSSQYQRKSVWEVVVQYAQGCVKDGQVGMALVELVRASLQRSADIQPSRCSSKLHQYVAICMYVYVCVCIYIYMYIYIVCVNVYLYTHADACWMCQAVRPGV